MMDSIYQVYVLLVVLFILALVVFFSKPINHKRRKGKTPPYCIEEDEPIL